MNGRPIRAALICLLSGISVNATAQIAAADFFLPPDLLTVTLSPDGQNLAAISGINSDQKLVLIDADSGSQTTLLRLAEFSENDASLSAIGWLDNDTVAAQFSEVRTGVKNLLDTRNTRYLLIVRLPVSAAAPAEVLSVRTPGWLVDPLPQSPRELLYAKSGPYSRVYRIQTDLLAPHKMKLGKLSKIDGGQFVRSNEVAQVEGYATRWFVTPEGSPRAVLHFKDGGLSLSALREDDETEELKTWTARDLASDKDDDNETPERRLVPVTPANEDNTFYCLDITEEEQRSVYAVNYKTGSEKLVFEAGADEIIDLIQSPADQRLIGVRVLRQGELHSIYLDNPDGHDGASEGRAATMRIDIEQDLTGDRVLSYVEGHDQPGQFWLRSSGGDRLVGSVLPKLDSLDSVLTDGKVAVEGLDIHYLLTTPATASQSPVPLIVMPHGGPIGVFDTRYFDSTTQFFAANNYAVLRVNFRGSSGYSTELREAGTRQWGDLMLRDIRTATEDVAARPDIDANRICIFGLSYGGYAATMLTIRHPELYRCAINVAGVSDVTLHLNKTGRSKRTQTWLTEHVGDTVADYDNLKSISPVYSVDQLQRPLLLLHGAKDEVVDVEHAWRLKRMLDKHQKDYTWHVFPEGKHGFGDIDESIDLHSRVIDFLGTHLD